MAEHPSPRPVTCRQQPPIEITPAPRPGSFPASPPYDDNWRALWYRYRVAPSESRSQYSGHARLKQATARTRRPVNTQASGLLPACRLVIPIQLQSVTISSAEPTIRHPAGPPSTPDKLWPEVGWLSSQFIRYFRNHTSTCHRRVSIRRLGTRPLAAHPSRPRTPDKLGSACRPVVFDRTDGPRVSRGVLIPPRQSYTPPLPTTTAPPCRIGLLEHSD